MTDTLDLDSWHGTSVQELRAEVRRLRAENAALQETGWEWNCEPEPRTPWTPCAPNHSCGPESRQRKRRKAGPWIPAPEGTEK